MAIIFHSYFSSHIYIMKIGVLGSGAMGTGIAQIAATAAYEVIIFDANQTALEKAKQNLQAILLKLSEKGKISAEEMANILGRIYFAKQISDFTDCEMVIEAIIEDLAIKQAVFQDLEKIVGKNCILATNTSSLSIASIAAACQHAERVVGIHFFNPVPLMELVEIIPAVQTAENVTEKALHFVQKVKKKGVLTKDTPGFIVNRVARPYYGEAIRIMEEGIADIATIDWAMTTLGGFRMGPFTLIDFIGSDVNYRVSESVWTQFFYEPRFKPSFSQKRLFEASYFGRKTGRGFYNYAEDAPKLAATQDEDLGNYIKNRILAMLINEAADAVLFQIGTAQDIDLAMTKGVNYPKGLLQWADEIGIAKVVETIDELYNEYREDRYRCSALLRRMAKNGKTFY